MIHFTPADQQGKYTSPGREFVSGIRFFCSQTGDRLAALQVEKVLSLKRSCREIISPRPWHATAMILFYNRDTSFYSYMGAPSLYSTAARNSFGKRWRPRAGMGAADNHTPDWGRESDNIRAFPLSDVWVSINILRATSSRTSCVLLWVGCDIDKQFISTIILVKVWYVVGRWPFISSTNLADCDIEPI